MYSSQQLAEPYDKHYFTIQKDDQTLIGEGSHHHSIQQKLQLPRHIASKKLASVTWEKDEEAFCSRDKATVKMDGYRNPKVLESEDISQILCKLLKLHAAPEVDIEPVDGNTLNYHYFMVLFKEVVESKIDDPRGRLTGLIKYTTGDAKELIKHCIRLPSNEGFKNVKYLLERFMGIHIKFLFHIEGKSSNGHKLNLEMQRASENPIISC